MRGLIIQDQNKKPTIDYVCFNFFNGLEHRVNAIKALSIFESTCCRRVADYNQVFLCET